jgi:hypothetical protein
MSTIGVCPIVIGHIPSVQAPITYPGNDRNRPGIAHEQSLYE